MCGDACQGWQSPAFAKSNSLAYLAFPSIDALLSRSFALDAITGTARMRSARRAPQGLRDAQKRERLERIKRAARELFIEKGYDNTTLRMIGKRAKLGAGTILRYVEDKRALLYLLFNEDHLGVTEKALAASNTDKGFLDRNIDGFRPYYRYFGKHPELARAILREATFYKPKWPSHTSAGEAARRSIDRIRGIVHRARERGEITNNADDETISLLIFEIYQMEARRWLAADHLKVELGLRELKDALAILLRGLH
jgi:AcrR family transcriptional regulator